MSAIDQIKAALGPAFDHRASYALLPKDHAELRLGGEVGVLDNGMVIVDLGKRGPAPAPAPVKPPPAAAGFLRKKPEPKEESP